MSDEDKTTRVYHPSLPSWQDVPESRVDSWVESGWLKSKSKNVDYGDLPEIGSHPGIAAVPVLEDVSRTTTRSSGGSRTTSSSTTAGGASAGSTTA
jgi:hypothetical protein